MEQLRILPAHRGADDDSARPSLGRGRPRECGAHRFAFCKIIRRIQGARVLESTHIDQATECGRDPVNSPKAEQRVFPTDSDARLSQLHPYEMKHMVLVKKVNYLRGAVSSPCRVVLFTWLLFASDFS